jgi:DNA polymerase-1
MLYAFDVNSHFARTYTVQAPNGVLPTHPGAYENGQPVFCLKPLMRLVQNEINAVHKLDLPNSHIVLVFDHWGKNFRHDIFPDYKGNRDPKPDEWLVQEESMYQMFVDAGFSCLRVPGYESDDVLGTLADKLSKLGIPSIIFTGDKDLMSLVDDNVSVYNGKTKKLINAKSVMELYGVPPARLIDYLAMQGDVADNVPGVTGAGPKSAAVMANAHSIEELLKNPSLVLQLGLRTGKRIARHLEQDKEQILLSKRLVSLDKNVVLNMKLSDMKVSKAT